MLYNYAHRSGVGLSNSRGPKEKITVSQQATAFSTLGGRLETENPVLGDVDSLDAVLREPAEVSGIVGAAIWVGRQWSVI